MTSYVIGGELPNLDITWTDSSSNIIDFSTGWTFTVKLGHLGATAELTKTSGITGAATAPNLTIAWAAGEFDSLPAGARTLQVFARHTATGKDRVLMTGLSLLSAVA